ncbi:MAG: hypothetical protein HYX84_06115 [Chloroflexi bacterium]|nr:hypothetical protein [Chloroflexota bacterium]
MKIALSLLLVLLMLGSAGAIGCGAKKNPGTAAEPGAAATRDTRSSGLFNWNDMPIYAGAGQIEKAAWAIPPAQGEYTRAEWRYYDTRDSAEKVGNFYNNQMAAKGWKEQGWFDMQGTQWGMFSKSNDADVAMVWISTQDGKTVIALMKASK